jgi:hypothetical protein
VASVVDYSDAQRSGFQAAYARFMTTTQKGLEYQFQYWNHEGTSIFELYLNKEGSGFTILSYDDHYRIAGSLLKGCQYHWKESVTRIAKNSAIVPMKQQSYFRHLTSELLKSDTLQDFNSTIHTIEKEFPNTNSWLE